MIRIATTEPRSQIQEISGGRLGGILSVCAFLVAGVSVTHTAIAKAQIQDNNFVKYHPSPKVRVIPKLPYARYERQQLFLDLYLPLPLARSRPGVVVVRGGGWLVGDREGTLV